MWAIVDTDYSEYEAIMSIGTVIERIQITPAVVIRRWRTAAGAEFFTVETANDSKRFESEDARLMVAWARRVVEWTSNSP